MPYAQSRCGYIAISLLKRIVDKSSEWGERDAIHVSCSFIMCNRLSVQIVYGVKEYVKIGSSKVFPDMLGASHWFQVDEKKKKKSENRENQSHILFALFSLRGHLTIVSEK